MATDTKAQPVLRLGDHVPEWVDVELDGTTYQVPDFHKQRTQRHTYAELDAVWNPYAELREAKAATSLDTQTCLTRMGKILLPQVEEDRIKRIHEDKMWELMFATGYLSVPTSADPEGAEGTNPPDEIPEASATPKPDSPDSTDP